MNKQNEQTNCDRLDKILERISTMSCRTMAFQGAFQGRRFPRISKFDGLGRQAAGADERGEKQFPNTGFQQRSTAVLNQLRR
jgi:hypothetical protein